MEEILALLVLAGIVMKKKCHSCNSKWTLNEKCLVCHEEVCRGCGVNVPPESTQGWPLTDGGRCCNEHLEIHEERVRKKAEYVWRSEEVEIFPASYRGRTPDPVFNIEIESRKKYEDQKDAERDLKIVAAMSGAEFVVDFELHSHPERKGNYRYKLWSASGLI